MKLDLSALLPSLKVLGLSEGEALLYTLILEHKSGVALGNLIYTTRMKRATVYLYVQNLEHRGLVSTYKENQRLHVRPSGIHGFLNKEKSLFEEKQGVLKILEDIHQRLISDHSQEHPAWEMEVFYGEQGSEQFKTYLLSHKNRFLKHHPDPSEIEIYIGENFFAISNEAEKYRLLIRRK